MKQIRAEGYDLQHGDDQSGYLAPHIGKALSNRNRYSEIDNTFSERGYSPNRQVFTPFSTMEDMESKRRIIGADKIFDLPVPDDDYEELRAQNQGFWERAGKGAGKLVGLTANYIVGDVGGVLWGVGHALVSLDADKFIDNPFNDTMDSISDWINDGTQIYKTRAEREGSFWQRLSTSGFWFDDMMQGGAFMASAIAAAAITRGATSALRGANVSARAIKAADALAKGSKALKGQKIVSGVNRSVDMALQFGVSAHYEATVEARGFIEEARRQYEEEYVKEYGVVPPADKMAEFEGKVQEVAGNIYLGNAALVGAGNVIQGFIHGSRGIRAATRGAKTTFNPTTGQWAKSTAKAPWYNRVAAQLGRTAAWEGIAEEGGQAIMNDAGLYFLKTRYDLDGNIKND
jgi:hypothetical protein